MASVVRKITSLQPDLILAAKTVSRVAQNLIRREGVALAVNFKPGEIQDIARATEAQILTGLGAAVGRWVGRGVGATDSRPGLAILLRVSQTSSSCSRAWARAIDSASCAARSSPNLVHAVVRTRR